VVIRNAFIRTDLEPDLPAIRGDLVQLQQVLVNLALDGCGTGLTAECQARIFEPFFSSKREGMGMGLPIARSIVDAHGGRLWAVNNADCGATFFFILTATGRGRAAAAPVLEPAPGRGRYWSGAA
jgi:two-component system, LuxR family, sensor kinase FixL